MTHQEAIAEFHRAGAFGVAGNLLAYWTSRLVRRMKERAETRLTVREIGRLDRVHASKICDGCGQRGRHGHSWFCTQGKVTLFYLDTGPSDLRRSSCPTFRKSSR